VILDRDSKFDATVITFLKATGLKPKRTSIQSPWQNRTAERWVGSFRREILDHVIALDERHLLRLMRDYVSYYQEDRIHDSLEKDTRTSGQSNRSRPRPQTWPPCRASVACTIAPHGASGVEALQKVCFPVVA
jgi:hypothetical protein